MTNVLDELTWRGLVAESTDPAALREVLGAPPMTFYVGFDPTAPSLHIGHLVQLITAGRLQRAGHRPLALVGGATGLIGDPRLTQERRLNDPDLVATWVDRLREQIEPFLSFEGPVAAAMVDNLEWTRRLSAIELLRDVGKHFSVNRMLDREAVAVRLATTGISYTEFSYVLLQSNDYLELFRRHGCSLQLGGSDQWGNITAGCDLIRRVEGVRTHALATPLITKADGTKFGKTETGTVWLDPTMTSPYAFYQFWINTDDRDVVRYLKVFSRRGADEVAELETSTLDRPSARAAQRALAEEITTLVHGSAECTAAVAASRALFGLGDLQALDRQTLAAAMAEIPSAAAPVAAKPVALVDLLVTSGLAPSRAAARRTIAEGGAYVNNRRHDDAEAYLGLEDLLHGRWLVLRRGKRTVAGIDAGLPG